MIRIITIAIVGLALFLVGALGLLCGNSVLESEAEFAFEATKKFESKALNLILADAFLWRLTKLSALEKLDLNCNTIDSYNIPFEKLSKNFFIEDNIFYAISASKKVFAFDLSKKEVLWSFDSDKKILASFLLVDELLIFASADNYIVALDKNKGEIAFKYETQDVVNDKLVLDDSRLYFGDCAGVLSLYDIKNRSAKTKEISAHLPTSPLVVGEDLLILDYENSIFSLNKLSLEEKLKVESDVEKILKVDEKVFALASDLYSIDLENGNLEKIISLDEALSSMELYSKDIYLLISELGSLYIFDSVKKEILFEYKFGLALSAIKVCDEKIFIMDSDSYIHILKRRGVSCD